MSESTPTQPPEIELPRSESVELRDPGGNSCVVSPLGAALHQLYVPDREGQHDNIVLGYPTEADYLSDPFFLGVTVGRVANRIGSARFSLGDRTYELEANNGPHHLHGGSQGWYRKLWRTEHLESSLGAGVRFTLVSPSGDAGYPGEIHAQVSYLLRGNDLHIVMMGTASELTLLNLAHHTYFNLGKGPDILDHELKLNADQITLGSPVPTGAKCSVEATPFDFRSLRRVGLDMPHESGGPPGFDHNFLLRDSAAKYPTFTPTSLCSTSPLCRGVSEAAILIDPQSGRKMQLLTNQPAMQLYTGNYLDGRQGRNHRLSQHAALCLETQAIPNFINLPEFVEQGRLEPGYTYRHEMQLRFSTIKA